ncbi:MAG: hypothetical protein ACP5SE_04750, partial [Nitrososphaeria archaeon]
YREPFSESVKRLRKPFAVALYTKLGVTMDRIAEGFHSVGLPMSTKTVSKWVGKERTRGFDIYRNKQTYNWTKFKGKLYRLWVRGKISSALINIFRTFLAWVYYYQMTGIFDLEAVLAGEKPP